MLNVGIDFSQHYLNLPFSNLASKITQNRLVEVRTCSG